MRSIDVKDWAENCINIVATEVMTMENAFRRNESVPIDRLILLSQLLVPLYSVQAVAQALMNIEGYNGRGGER